MVIWKVINAARQSGWVKAAAALCVLAICIGSLLPETERVPTGLPFGKLEHFLAYRDRTFAWTRDVKQEGSDLGGTEFSLARLPPGVLAAMERGRHPRVSDAVVGESRFIGPWPAHNGKVASARLVASVSAAFSASSCGELMCLARGGALACPLPQPSLVMVKEPARTAICTFAV